MSTAGDATTIDYVGNELELFADAGNWKRYWHDQVRPFLSSTVLDVGAGIGASAAQCCGPAQSRWLALEPDPALAARMERRIAAGELPRQVEVRVGTLDDLPADARFDSILYADVLEHIEDDRAQLAQAVSHLKPGGHVIVLCPAHQWLFSPFDRAIGHYRRYSKPMFRALQPAGAELVRLRYLDSVGLLASAANRLALRQSMPTAAQLRVWNRLMVPPSRVLDPLLGFALGKSILGVWQRR